MNCLPHHSNNRNTVVFPANKFPTTRHRMTTRQIPAWISHTLRSPVTSTLREATLILRPEKDEVKINVVFVAWLDRLLLCNSHRCKCPGSFQNQRFSQSSCCRQDNFYKPSLCERTSDSPSTSFPPIFVRISPTALPKTIRFRFVKYKQIYFYIGIKCF